VEMRSVLRMPASAFEDDARGLINLLMAQRFLWVTVAVCAIGAIASWLQPFAITPANRGMLIGAQVVLALLCIVGTRLSHRLSARVLVLVAAWASVTAATLAALSLGHGAHSLELSFYPLVVCVVAVLAGTRPAFALTSVCALIVVALTVGEAQGWLPGATVLAQMPLSHPLTTHGLLLMAGFTIGAIMLRLSNVSYRSAQEREARFRSLLAIAADHYWELDERLCLRRADDAGSLQSSALLAQHMDRPLLQLMEARGHDAHAQARCQADLRAQRPFAGLRGSLRDANGQTMHLEFSGQPRCHADGRFAGYWGVARDVSELVRSEAALRRSESMLSTLFSATPECVALTELDSGRFLMVNQAFVHTFGHPREHVIGRTSLDIGLWLSPEDRKAMQQALHEHGQVTSARVALRTRAGRHITVLLSAATCRIDDVDTVVVNARDVTADERTRQEHAAILQHASIGIAFTREAHIASANPCFERMFGWDIGALAGQPTAVLGAELELTLPDESAPGAGAPGAPIVVERQVTRRDGSRFWCRLHADALAGADPQRRGTIWIAEDVTERHQVQQDLAAARDAAEAASRAKSAFLANTSHEIRTPLNGVLGLARLALRDDLDEAQRKTYVAHILESGQALAATLTDILDLSKIEAGKLDIEAIPFRLRDALEAVRHSNLAVAHAKGLAVELTIDAALPPVMLGDAMRTRQIVNNFVANAIKFTDAGSVCIEARVGAEGTMRLSVHDTGIGIDHEVQGRLFQPFSQADQSTTRRFGGTGLGLSICRELARLMGGHVGVSSALGAGSEFWAELPLTPVGEHRLRAACDDEADDVRALRGSRVLVGEDNAVNMMITLALLEQWGVNAVQATDGLAVVEAVQQADVEGQPFDAVLMDVQMPRLSGHAASRLLHERFGERTPPIIALTAAALVSEREEALRAGMRDFLTKPVNAERMRTVLASWVGRARVS